MTRELLTEFQIVTESALVAFLGNRNRRLENRALGGESETYVKATISGTPLEVWIYDDAAEVSGPGIDARFEPPDYQDAEALRRAFVSRAVELAERTWPAV